MTDLQKFQRAARVFLARLLTVHGKDAHEVLRRMAVELKRHASIPSAGPDHLLKVECLPSIALRAAGVQFVIMFVQTRDGADVDPGRW